jgi:heme exporter protein A
VTVHNGSGKSSLLRLISGLAHPIEGTIHWNHASITNNQAYYLNRHFIGHLHGLKEGLTVLENLALLLMLHQKAGDANEEECLAQFALTGVATKPVWQLSAGQKRRLALTKLLLIYKPLWILDEPFTSLDAHTQQILKALMNEHCRKGGIIVMSSHHPMETNTESTYHLSLSS